MTTHPMTDIRDVLIDSAAQAPVDKEQSWQVLCRMRRWSLDLAEQMVPLVMAANQFGDVFDVGMLLRPLALAREDANLQPEDDLISHPDMTAAVASLGIAVEEAMEYERMAEYTPVWSAARAGLQAIHTAVSEYLDDDILSWAIRLPGVAEKCALAEAYSGLARVHDTMPSRQETVEALKDARQEMGAAYLQMLHARMDSGFVEPLHHR